MAAPSRIRTFGLDPSWFAFRAADARGAAVQLLSLGGTAVGLWLAIDRFGPIRLSAGDQMTQLAYLASVIGLLPIDIAAAAATDAALSSAGGRRTLGLVSADRAAAALPALAALIVAVLLPPALFAIGGQWLYLGVAGVGLAAVIVAIAIGYRGAIGGPGARSEGPGGAGSGTRP